MIYQDVLKKQKEELEEEKRKKAEAEIAAKEIALEEAKAKEDGEVNSSLHEGET